MAHELPKLPYAFNALEPHVDARTMEIHHGKHHATYVNKLNAALSDHPDLQSKSLEELVAGTASLPDSVRGAVINHGGGHLNHSIFWNNLSPGGGGTPGGGLADAIQSSFGGWAAPVGVGWVADGPAAVMAVSLGAVVTFSMIAGGSLSPPSGASVVPRR